MKAQKGEKGEKGSQLEAKRSEMAASKSIVSKIAREMKENESAKVREGGREWGLCSQQRKIEQKVEILPNKVLKSSEVSVSKAPKAWSYSTGSQKIGARVLGGNVYYPPSCSGYDMAYCKHNDSIYIYGGIPCSSSLQEGIKQYFYRLTAGKWSEVRAESAYSPTPRYGHTLTAYQKELVLFGGVSEYKEKLKDRCFYTDCSAYSPVRNNWRILETSRQNVKTRKNHAAVVYGKFYIVSGGLDESEETINEVSWNNLECRKSSWKGLRVDGRFNHKMVVVQPQNGKDFLCIFGGRNASSEIVSTLFYLPLATYDGELVLKDLLTIPHSVSPRETPLLHEFLQGFLILGGINENSDVVEDCWYYNGQKQLIEEFKLGISFADLRGAKATSFGDKLYVLAGNSTHFKALQIEAEN